MRPDDLPSRGRTVAAVALAVGLGLFWLLLVFAQYRAGTWVDGIWVFDDGAWAFDPSAYVNAAQRLIDEGSLYLRAQVDAPYVPGGEGYYHYAPPLGVAMLAFTHMSLADASVVWWAMHVGALLESLGMDGISSTLSRVTGIVVTGITMLASLRREREIGDMVVLFSSMLVVPLLWDHHLATLVVPAAFLAQRLWRPLILQPLLSWLPIGAPILILATMLLAFLVKEEWPEPAGSAA